MSEKKNISKKELRRRKRKRALMIKTGILCVLLVIFGIGIWALAGGTEKIQQKAQEKEDQKTAEVDGSVSSDSLCLAYCGLFTVIFSSTLRPKNSPPDCFLYGLSNPVLQFHL